MDNPKARGERLTTQPEMTNERSLGSIALEDNRSSINEGRHNSQYESEKLVKVSHWKNRASEEKNSAKNLNNFTKNFVNQGNFLQNQYMSGHYKRIKS